MNDTETLYEAVGGRDAVVAAVEEFYQRVLGDPQVAPYFANTTLPRLMGHQRAFIGMVLGGPDAYAGRSMSAAHESLQVTNAAFDRVVQHLVETLRSLGVGETVVQRVVAGVAPVRAEIVTA